MLAAGARSGAKPITTSGAKRVAESILGIGLQLLDKGRLCRIYYG